MNPTSLRLLMTTMIWNPAFLRQSPGQSTEIVKGTKNHTCLPNHRRSIHFPAVLCRDVPICVPGTVECTERFYPRVCLHALPRGGPVAAHQKRLVLVELTSNLFSKSLIKIAVTPHSCMTFASILSTVSMIEPKPMHTCVLRVVPEDSFSLLPE